MRTQAMGMQIEALDTIQLEPGNPSQPQMEKNTPLASYQNQNAFSELKKLKIRLRNQIRAIVASKDSKAVKLLDSLREKASAVDIYKMDKVLRAHGKILPDLFPTTPQTKELFIRLQPLQLGKQVEIVARLTSEYLSELIEHISLLNKANDLIVKRELHDSAELLNEIIQKHGYSQIVIRKLSLIRALKDPEIPFPEIESLLNEAGAGSNNVIISSLLNCYQEEQEVLSLKRSIMNLPDRGKQNRYTRDIARITFHPFASNEEDLSNLILSCLQSSLIDAILIIKINSHLLQESELTAFHRIFSEWNNKTTNIDVIASLYRESSEYLFYKHSSAWLEDSDIIQYRTLIDHFHDTPEATYFNLDQDLIYRASKWVNKIELADLATEKAMTCHSHQELRDLESTGNITRSALFNLLTHNCEGATPISEAALIKIMSSTTGLARTINIGPIKTLAQLTPSATSKIILYALISKKSNNEADNYKLRSLLQNEIIKEHNKDIVSFLNKLSEKSGTVAEYIYDICTEDFIARLSHIIKASNQITETRASLHKWMGEFTGEKAYLDRARTLLIDHQINRVRNELDDNRIYVHTARFSEWINDEIIRELNTILTSMEHNNTLAATESPQLIHIIEQCYRAFCSNSIFGIASYLGRRIRHGTFRGHLFSSVVAIAKSDKYKKLLTEPPISAKWEQWVSTYEATIDNIITNKLHIESQSKRDGLLKPHLKGTGKFDIALACAKALIKEFIENKTTSNFNQVITEYCWRLAEVDLKSINSYLKGQKTNLIQSDLLTSMKSSTQGRQQEVFKDFNRELLRLIDEKLIAMYGWFKRPASVSPKASLSLLYKAVVAEVIESFLDFQADTHFEEKDDIELMGGPYHILYDAFYVVVYNAAKHGKPKGEIERKFGTIRLTEGTRGKVVVTISSEIKECDDEALVIDRLRVHPDDDIDNAHLYEDRSGIRKLYQLERADPNFSIDNVECINRKVSVCMSYALEHL